MVWVTTDCAVLTGIMQQMIMHNLLNLPCSSAPGWTGRGLKGNEMIRGYLPLAQHVATTRAHHPPKMLEPMLIGMSLYRHCMPGEGRPVVMI